MKVNYLETEVLPLNDTPKDTVVYQIVLKLSMPDSKVEKPPENTSGILDIVYESLTQKGIQHLETGEVAISASNYKNLEKVVGSKPFNDWLLDGGQVSDDALFKVSDELSRKKNEPIVKEFFVNNIQYTNAVKLYGRMINSICREVRLDVRNNEGKKIRSIINNTQLGGINDIITSHEMSKWLFEEHEEATVYDLEEAVAKATILHIAVTYTNFMKDQDIPRSAH